MRAAPVVHSQRMSTAAAATAAVVSSRALEARADSCEASSDATLIIMATFATRPHHCSVTFAAMYFLLSGTVPIRRLSIIIGSTPCQAPRCSGCAPASGQTSLILFSFVFVSRQQPLLRGRAFRADRMLRLAGIVRKNRLRAYVASAISCPESVRRTVWSTIRCQAEP